METMLTPYDALRSTAYPPARDELANDPRYMAIPPGAIIPGTLPNFKIYVLVNQRRVLWAADGNRVTPEQIEKLSGAGHKQVFIALEEEIKYGEYLESNLGLILESQAPSDEQKAAIFSNVSTKLVKDTYESSLAMGVMTRETLQRTQTMIERALIFITESKSLDALAKMIGHDYQTYEHATKVLWFTMAFLRDNEDILEDIQTDYHNQDHVQRAEMLRTCGVAALLHDIGKAFIPPEILCKTGALTQVEWEVMKRHPLNGLAMLTDTHLPAFIKKTVAQHHEDFQGGGYPMGLDGPNITTLARVLRIVDAFEAMTSSRPYKEAMSPIEAAGIMVGKPADGASERDRGMARCFDPKMLRKFIVFLGRARLSL
jgi:HD-GYP domain-containing protein (c-di-GMP phosphodiesterase class II)